jgi:hypothetical protein
VRTVYNGNLLIVLVVTDCILFKMEYSAFNMYGLTAACCVQEI